MFRKVTDSRACRARISNDSLGIRECAAHGRFAAVRSSFLRIRYAAFAAFFVFLSVMKTMIDIFGALGRELADFGRTPATEAVIRRAVKENAWFQPQEIVGAVEAIRSEMLDRARLEAWAGDCVPARRRKEVLVIMAGNIPLVGFFDLLCVLMSGHACRIKPSGKDRVLMEYVVGRLLDIEPGLPLGAARPATRPDAVIATGSGNANRCFRSLYSGVPALLRGNRQSAAVLAGDESDAELRGLEEDIFSYSGLGCRSVSLLFLPRGCMPALRCTATNPKYRHDYLRQRALLRMRRLPYVDLEGAVLYEERSFPAALSRLHYTFYDTPDEVEEWLAAHDDELQCVVSRCVRHSRLAAFGAAQHPGLTDYADGRDTMRFLAAI